VHTGIRRHTHGRLIDTPCRVEGEEGGGGGHEGLKIDRRASRSEMEPSKDASAAAGERDT